MLKKKLLRRYSRDLTLRSLPFAYTTTLLAWVTFAPLCALGVAANEAREGPVAAQPLHVHALRDEAPLGLVLLVVLLLEGREAPVVRDVDLLAPRDLRRRAAQRLRARKVNKLVRGAVFANFGMSLWHCE